jgi:predicted ATP-grasp superfamily ATP-dependent carboligase
MISRPVHDRDRTCAIVTNARNRIAYNIARSLGKKKVPVHTADCVTRSMCYFSTYSKGHFLYPSPFKDPQGFIRCLLEKSSTGADPVLIPVFEETFLVAKFKEQLSQHYKLVVPDYEQILVAHNKDRWEPIARGLGIPVPETYTAESLRQNPERIGELRYPVLAKPKQGGGAWAIKQIDSRYELQDLLARDNYCGLPWERFFFQRKICGETHCVAMLFRQGELRARVVYKQLRDYPVTGGQATLRVSIRNAEIESHFKSLLEDLGWHGVCQADFVVDKETRVPFLIDVNPRFWGSLVQAIASGVDFPYLLYRMAIDGDVDPVPEYRAEVTTRWLGGDLRTFLPLLRRSQSKLDFIREFLFPQNRSALLDDFSWQDPLPFWIWSLDALLKVVKHRSFEPVAHDSLEGIWE